MLSEWQLRRELKRIINKKESEESRWITQKEDDMNMIPSGCAHCGEKMLRKDNQGWVCKICNNQINAVSYYQGANAKAKTLDNKETSGVKNG